ncbi:MAG: PD-(D/E)XK nuclease family protein [Mycobacterium sp.]|nr:PD-(D/E)XK nuclease family protein [Mycobacterium sp.]
MSEQLVTRLLPVLATKLQEEFNVFDVMRYGGHEKQLSDVFAWLLDAEGTHQLGDAFQRIFIDEVNRGIGDAEPVAYGSFGVRQEVNTADAGAGGDVADLIVEDKNTVLVVENYYTSSGHGHGYHGYLSFGEQEGKRSVVVLLCAAQNSAEQGDGWEEASVVTYSRLVQRLMDHVAGDESYRRDCAAQYSFIDQMHKRFVKGRKMNDGVLIDFIDAMCRTGEAGRYGKRPIEPAAVQFADHLREQAKAQFDESREVLQRLKAALRNYAAEVLKGQINQELGREYISGATATFRGSYEWTVNFFTTSEPEAVLQLKFGPSAWYANEQKHGDWGKDVWEQVVPVDQADYSHLFITRDRKAIRQSVVTLREALEGLSPDDLRLRDEIVRFIRDRA